MGGGFRVLHQGEEGGYVVALQSDDRGHLGVIITIITSNSRLLLDGCFAALVRVLTIAATITPPQTAEDTILPMKLYTSSLNGQGLNLKVTSTNIMLTSAEEFDKQTVALKKAAKSKDVEKSTVAIQKVRGGGGGGGVEEAGGTAKQ